METNNKNYRVELSIRLNNLRRKAGYTTEEVGSKLSPPKSRSIIAYYENGTNVPSLDVLFQLAELYGVSVDFLLGRTEIRGIASNGSTPDEIKTFFEHKDTSGYVDDDISLHIEELLDFIRGARTHRFEKRIVSDLLHFTIQMIRNIYSLLELSGQRKPNTKKTALTLLEMNDNYNKYILHLVDSLFTETVTVLNCNLDEKS